MFKKFYPRECRDSTYDINFETLYKKGYRGVIFDIDNTLVCHNADASQQAKDLFMQLEQIGFQSCLLSNNQIERVERFNKEIGTHYIYNAHKPSTKNYCRAMEIMGTNKNTTIFVGDQLFTDIYGANRAGIATILVKPIHPKEEIQIVLKRYLEKIVLFFYNRQKNKNEVLF